MCVELQRRLRLLEACRIPDTDRTSCNRCDNPNAAPTAAAGVEVVDTDEDELFRNEQSIQMRGQHQAQWGSCYLPLPYLCHMKVIDRCAHICG